MIFQLYLANSTHLFFCNNIIDSHDIFSLRSIAEDVFKVSGAECIREQIGKCPAEKLPVRQDRKHAEIRSAKLRHDLTADAAGRDRSAFLPFRPAANGDGGKMTFAFRNCPEKGDPFCADGRRVGRVFNIATKKTFSVFRQERGSDREMRVRRVGNCACPARRRA